MIRKPSRALSALLVLSVLGRLPSAAEPGAAELLETSGVRGGLVVCVGFEHPALLAELRAAGPFLVQGLQADPGKVAEARKLLAAKGLYGPVTVSRTEDGRLPYVDGLVNLLVLPNTDVSAEASAKAGCRLPNEEITRVLAPRGVVVDMRNGGRATFRKPVPSSIDDWSHHMYDASGIGTGRDTAVGQPRSAQWKAGPEYGRSHENMSSVSAVVSAGGRVFAIMDEGPKASVYLPARWFLSARDAFSGVLLWKLPIKEWHAQLYPLKSGPLQLPRRLVATEDRVYATLALDASVSEIEAATGKVLGTFADTEHAEELLYTDGRLIVVTHAEKAGQPYKGRQAARSGWVDIMEQALRREGNRCVTAIDTAGGKTVWKTAPGPVTPLTVAARNNRGFLLRGNQLVCINMADGKTAWTQTVAPKAVGPSFTTPPTLLVHQGIVYVALKGELTARAAEDGKTLWAAPCATSGYRAQASVFIVDNLAWDVSVGGEPYRPGSDSNKINRFYTGYDLRSGEVRKKLPVSGEHGYAIMHHRCHVPRASGSNIITSFPGIEFFNVKNGTVTHDSWIRGACLYGFMPANGLLYTPPHPCACYTQGKLTGFWAVAPERQESGDRSQGTVARLDKGPAFRSTRVSALSPQPSGSWPTFRGNAARSGVTKAAVPAVVKPLWHADISGDLSQCVIAGGTLFVASAGDHTVHALDAANGKALWNYTAGGRIDSAPTAYGGTIIFGSRDGYVYCLTAGKGELVWRFRAAPVDRRCVAYDQVESVWPVHGSVLVQNDILWFCAGRSSFLDGGLRMCRLDPRTGKIQSETRVDSLEPSDKQPPITSTLFARLDMEGAKNDVLSCDGEHVFMRHWAFDLGGKSIEQNIDHLFSPTGFLDASWFRRTYWIYGRNYVSGAQGWARTGNVRPTGRILSIDADRIYGFGRNFYPPSPGNKDQMYARGEREMFFAAAKSGGETVAPPRAGDSRKKSRGKSQGKPVLWSVPGDIRVHGMVLTGAGDEKRLFVTGSRGDWVRSQDAYDGKLGNVLRVLAPSDGKTIAEHDLPGLPVFDGLSAADGRLYVSLADGRVLCMGK